MKILLIILSLLISTQCFGAELLVKAEDAWGTNPAKSVKGDIIVVRPDGWVWGREECPPRFVVIKMPGVKVDDVKYLEQPLMDKTDPEKPVLLKRRQYTVGNYVDTISGVGGSASISKVVFDTKLTDKSK